MEPIQDFTKRRSFPGTRDNDLDIILRRVDDLEKIPALLFTGLLFLIAIPPTFGAWWWTVGLWLFLLGDWLLLLLLPHLGRSYGNPRPPLLILALLRALVAWLFAFLPLPGGLALQLAGTLLVGYSFWIEPFRLSVTRQALQSPKLRPGQPVRILHLSDLHVERITQRERSLNQFIQELRPDLILFSGDILNLSYLEDPQAWQAAREVLSQWTAPCGVYLVTGSPAVDLEHIFPRLVKGLDNLRWLRDESVTVEVNGQRLNIIGLTCTHKPFVDAPRLERLLQAGEDQPFTILLYHSPDLAPNAANTGAVDLQLSGHTHGGQIRLPVLGALVTGSLYGKRFEAGREVLGKMTMYITRGIGLEGKGAPRARFLCPPEIILWEIDGIRNGQTGDLHK